MNIKLLVMDVDGTLTDGYIYLSGQGEVMKAFDIKDGYAIKHILPVLGITPIIITGRKSDIVECRAKELNVFELYQGVSNKITVLRTVAKKYSATLDEIAYIGDDLNDLPCIELCGFTACPGDAVDEVKQKVKYVCKCNGGRGAVRELITILESKLK